MTTQEFDDFVAILEERGYKKTYDYIYKRHQYYKAFGKRENPYEENRALYQVFFNVFDWRKCWDRDPFLRERNKAYSFDVNVCVSRVIDEVPIECRFDDFKDIDKVEKRAEAFFKYVESMFDIPEREKIEE